VNLSWKCPQTASFVLSPFSSPAAASLSVQRRALATTSQPSNESTEKQKAKGSVKKGRSNLMVPAVELTPMEIFRTFKEYIWPSATTDTNIKGRVLLALALLFSGKLLSVQVPFLFKHIIDQLSLSPAELLHDLPYLIPATLVISCSPILVSFG